MKPTVLLATTDGWFPTARLAIALAKAGCTVQAVCPPRHPLANTRAVRCTHTYHWLMPLMSFADAIAATEPDFIVPGDDLATRPLVESLRREFAQDLAHDKMQHITLDPTFAMVTVIGQNMRCMNGIVGRTFGALSRKKVKTIAIAQGASECTICFVVSQQDIRGSARH